MSALNLVTSISSSGYGVVGVNLLEALETVGCEVALFAIDTTAYRELHLDLSRVMRIQAALRRQARFDPDAPCLRITPEFDMALFAGRGPRAGLTFFETDRLSDRDRRHLGWLDHLLVPSAWARETAVADGLDGPRITVVPMGVDRAIFHEGEASRDGETVFLHVGKWERRKGQDFLLEAFERAFAPSDPVRLELLCDNPLLGDRNREWKDRCLRSSMAERIRLVPRVGSAREVADRMRAAHCGVFPSRAEGWNLELLEMMSCDKPVIATDYSGHTAFADSDNCRLISIDHLEEAVDERYSQIYGRRKIGRWARLGAAQMEQLVFHLRAVHQARCDGAELRNPEGVATARRHTWRRTAEVVLAALGA